MSLEEGQKIELESGEQFKITKVFPLGYYDMIALKPKYPDVLPDFFEEIYSIQLVNYKLI